jgi:tetratricopeptide (TPR) repeat protein
LTMSNSIQHIADNMLSMWEEAIRNPVKMVRIVINPGDEIMIKAFYDYMLAIDSDEEDMVFVLECPFFNPATFSKELLEYVETQIILWNESKKPGNIVFEHIEWKPDYNIEDKENQAMLAVSNFNRLTEILVGDINVKCSFIFDVGEVSDNESCKEWFRQALSLPFHKQMIWGIADIKGFEYFNKFPTLFPHDFISIYPPIDIDGAMEQLAEQAANYDRNDPAASKFRLALIKLMNSVKKGDSAQTDRYSKECLDMALVNVKNDINWLSQFVTVYTILYTDKIIRKDMDAALYFSGKAIESARLGIGKLDPSLAFRLLGNTLFGKGGILVRKSEWTEAAEVYQQAADAYKNCKDYLMQAEALRISGWCWEKKHEDGCAADCYIEGFRLIEKLSSDLIRNSSYPLLLLSLLHNSKRMEILSDDEMEKILSKVLGSDWKDYLYEYKRNLGKRYEPGQ